LALKERAASKRSHSAKSKTSPAAFSPSIGQKCHASETCGNSRDQTLAQSTLSQADFPARISASLDDRQASQMEPEAACGPKSCDLLASYNHDLSLWKTSQTSFLDLLSGEGDGLAEYSATWPRSGMTLAGTAYQLPPSAPAITEIGYGLLPTPNKSERGGKQTPGSQLALIKALQGWQKDGRRAFIPTIGKNESKGASSDRYRGSESYHGAKAAEALRSSSTSPLYTHPLFAELMMGFPIGWTELEPAATPSSPKSPNSSGEQS